MFSEPFWRLRKINEKSKYEHISEPLRLEYLLTLLIGKKYGLKGLVLKYHL